MGNEMPDDFKCILAKADNKCNASDQYKKTNRKVVHYLEC